MQSFKTKKVIAAVIKKDNKVFVAQRAKKDLLFGKWEFPGGKMEEGETEQECLRRELFEEFGIVADIGEYVCSSFFEHKGDPVEMRAYYVEQYSGEFHLYEHQEVRWVNASELLDYDMPTPDYPIVKALLS